MNEFMSEKMREVFKRQDLSPVDFGSFQSGFTACYAIMSPMLKSALPYMEAALLSESVIPSRGSRSFHRCELDGVIGIIKKMTNTQDCGRRL